jgi:error-prone DNA polymerase
VTAAALARLRNGTRVEVAGLVVARQRPATAKGITFMLLEDETGTINLIVPVPCTSAAV